jgi:hypothetical protein
LIKANLRWSIFCAATDRSMKTNLNWQSYFEIADQDIPFEEKMAGYVSLAREHFSVDEFESFCDTHLPQLDEVAYEFFASDTALDAIREKVTALYPEDEIESFTELFWSRVQKWRQQEGSSR